MYFSPWPRKDSMTRTQNLQNKGGIGGDQAGEATKGSIIVSITTPPISFREKKSIRQEHKHTKDRRRSRC